MHYETNSNIEKSTVVFTFSVFNLQVLSRNAFGILMFIFQQFTHRDLKPVTFLVLFYLQQNFSICLLLQDETLLEASVQVAKVII